MDDKKERLLQGFFYEKDTESPLCRNMFDSQELESWATKADLSPSEAGKTVVVTIGRQIPAEPPSSAANT